MNCRQLCLFAVVLASCGSPERVPGAARFESRDTDSFAGPAPAEPQREPPPPATTEPAPKPLTASDGVVDLAVEGFLPAVASVPLGARDPRPLIVATHGNYDAPQWTCPLFRGIAGAEVFVLCPRGEARADTAPPDVRYQYAHNTVLEREIDAATKALEARFPGHLDLAAPIYAGFSQGAIMGVAIALRHPKRFARLVLIEGGHDKWTPESAAQYRKGGGERVLFACGQPSCVNAAKAAASRLERAGIQTRVVHGEGVGHGYHGPVADQVRANFAWLSEGRSGWSR